MLIRDLLEELQKHGEENIEFMTFDKNGESPRRLELFICDGRFLYQWRRKEENPCNTIILGLMEDPNSFIGNRDAKTF